MSVIVNQQRAVGVYNRLSLPTYSTDIGKLNYISQSTVPSLQLDFTQERLDPRITFTRASSATRTNSAGLIETVSTDQPRFDYDPVTLQPKGLLIEEQRTNLLTYSEQFDNAAWGKNAATVTANATTAPDGTTTADSIAKSGAYGYVFQQVATAAGVSYSASVYAKAGTESKVTLLLGESNLGTIISRGYVDLTTGTITNVNGAILSVVYVGNGWWRISATGTTSAAVNIGVAVYPGIYSGSETGTVYIWGAQLEAGSFPTSYIPTTSAQATRAADVASMTGTNFSSWYNQTEGTLFAEFSTQVSDTVNSRGITAIDDSSNNNRVSLFVGAGAFPIAVSPRVVSGGVATNPASQGSISASTVARAALAYGIGVDKAGFCVSGGSVSLASTSSAPVFPNQLRIGTIFGTTFLGGHIKRIAYLPKRLSNTELQGITA